MSGDRDMRARAREAVAHYFGSEPRRLTRLAGGITNFVYRATHPEGDYIVRLNNDPIKINEYLKEQWAIACARDADVPVAELLEVGNHVGVPYTISPALAAKPAFRHPQRPAIIEELGRIMARVHTIPTFGFGETFDWSQNQLSRVQSWADYLTSQLHVEARLRLLVDHNMVTEAQQKWLQRELVNLVHSNASPVLNHGDPRLKNLLVDTSGQVVALIDWEFCISSIRQWDLSLALHDLSTHEKELLLKGYGLSSDEIEAMASAWRALNLINYAPYVEQAIATGDKQQIDNYRIRLSGALDLYSV